MSILNQYLQLAKKYCKVTGEPVHLYGVTQKDFDSLSKVKGITYTLSGDILSIHPQSPNPIVQVDLKVESIKQILTAIGNTYADYKHVLIKGELNEGDYVTLGIPKSEIDGNTKNLLKNKIENIRKAKGASCHTLLFTTPYLVSENEGTVYFNVNFV